jgi:hypothetical protein
MSFISVESEFPPRPGAAREFRHEQQVSVAAETEALVR